MLGGGNIRLGRDGRIIKQTRVLVKGTTNLVRFTRGDVLAINYRLRGFGFSFTGLCLGVKFKGLLQFNTTILLRNIIGRVAVEISLAMYSLVCFGFKVLDYAKKRFAYRKSKLYYLRDRVNLETIIRTRD